MDGVHKPVQSLIESLALHRRGFEDLPRPIFQRRKPKAPRHFFRGHCIRHVLEGGQTERLDLMKERGKEGGEKKKEAANLLVGKDQQHCLPQLFFLLNEDQHVKKVRSWGFSLSLCCSSSKVLQTCIMETSSSFDTDSRSRSQLSTT